MIGEIVISLRMFLVLSITLGILYPLGITAIAQLTMRDKANGSLIVADNKIIGSKLIGQGFTSSKYFHSRPSAVNYNAAGSGASNLGPSSKRLIEDTEKRIDNVRAENALNKTDTLPADIVLQSASGLDPHISINNALLQIHRVAKIRNISEDEIKKLINDSTDANFLGIWGQHGVNVLKLNLALDRYRN